MPSRLSGGLTRDGSALADSAIACLTFADITERRRAEDRLEHVARFDLLTGLANRNYFAGSLATADDGDSTEEAAIVYLDVDRLRTVNEVLGHHTGDLLLQAVAVRLKKLGNEARVLARVGADQFAATYSGARAGQRARALANAMLSTANEAYLIEGHRLIASLSIGLAAGKGVDATVLATNARTALDRAKAEGGHMVCEFTPEMLAGLRQRQITELELWHAFDAGQFEVYYQPQVCLSDRRIVGVEALMRWNHPERGLVSPADFVPVAEATGMIHALGSFVLAEACTTVAAWPTAIRVAVNVSPLQFRRGDLVGTVRRTLAQSGLSSARLELEITESLFMADSGIVNLRLAALREMGVGIALDDFGTGYSSLSYLQRLAVDKIKIDRSFVAGLGTTEDSRGVIEAVAAMAESLDITLNAEGIEREEQIGLLRLVGCTEGQGFLFGAPMPALQMRALLAAQEGPPLAISA
jgi:diguanylate cyclase (GGDEF)-like protein